MLAISQQYTAGCYKLTRYGQALLLCFWWTKLCQCTEIKRISYSSKAFHFPERKRCSSQTLKINYSHPQTRTRGRSSYKDVCHHGSCWHAQLCSLSFPVRCASAPSSPAPSEPPCYRCRQCRRSFSVAGPLETPGIRTSHFSRLISFLWTLLLCCFCWYWEMLSCLYLSVCIEDFDPLRGHEQVDLSSGRSVPVRALHGKRNKRTEQKKQ